MGNHKLLKTAGVNSRYSMYEFIAAVKSQAILWDRDHDDFHSRELRDRAWHEVGRKLCKNYDNANEEEKNDIARTLLKRWKNTRDSYLRVFRMRQSGQDRSRPSYIYERELSFLIDGKEDAKLLLDEASSSTQTAAAAKTTRDSKRQNARTGPSIKQETTSSSTPPQQQQQQARSETSSKANSKRKSRSDAKAHTKRTHYADETSAYDISFSLHNDDDHDDDDVDGKDTDDDDDEDDVVVAQDRHIASAANTFNNISISNLKPLDVTTAEEKKYEPIANTSLGTSTLDLGINTITNSTISVLATDPDQAFFESIKPHMQRMTDDQKLDFQIEVLRLLRNFKAK